MARLNAGSKPDIRLVAHYRGVAGAKLTLSYPLDSSLCAGALHGGSNSDPMSRPP